MPDAVTVLPDWSTVPAPLPPDEPDEPLASLQFSAKIGRAHV